MAAGAAENARPRIQVNPCIMPAAVLRVMAHLMAWCHFYEPFAPTSKICLAPVG